MKYFLHLNMFLDDDGRVKYEGKHYCYYEDDLKIIKKFNSRKEIYEFLKKEIVVLEGYKITDCLNGWIDEFIEKNKKDQSYALSIHGNQEIDIVIYEIKNEKEEERKIEDSHKGFFCKHCGGYN